MAKQRTNVLARRLDGSPPDAPPTAAVANDLVAAAFTKSVGATVHWRRGSPDLRLALLLSLGSVPTAFAGAWLVRALGTGEDQQHLLQARGRV